MKEKTLEMKKIIELIKQNTYEKKNKKNTIPEALISTKEKHIIKEEPIQMTKISKTDRVDTVVLQIGHHYINAPQQK